MAYLATAFALLEGALWVLPWFGSEDAAFRPLLGLLVMGFPVAIVLAWTYDVTSGRIVKTPEDLTGAEPEAAGPGWLVWTVLALMIGIAVQILRPR